MPLRTLSSEEETTRFPTGSGARSKHVVIVGAGLGGLATALRLAHRGARVTVLEKNDEIGGRNRPVSFNGLEFDGGPTLMMMLEPFRKLYSDVGERLEDHLEISLCDPSYRVFYDDGIRIEGTPNVARMVSQIERLFGRGEAERYGKLLGDLADLYRVSIPNFVRRNYNSLLDLASPKALNMVLKHGMLDNLARRIKRYHQDPHLHMLFTFQTMYLGLSPYDAPWVYGVLTYMEYGEGIWYPKGGMRRIHESVAELATARGAKIRTGVQVVESSCGTVTLDSGERIEADAVIYNADLPYAEQKLHQTPPPEKNRRYSCSALTMYIDYEGELPELLHHNVFFGADFEGNLRSLFRAPVHLPEDPAFYACISGRSDPERTRPGHENLFVLVPVPNLDHPWSAEDAERMREHVYTRLQKEVGFDPERVAGIKLYGPQDWAGDFNLDRGAAFGLSHDFLQSVCFRPSNRDRRDPKRFYVGASTAPGNGLPMVLISAELAEERLQQAGVL